MLLEIDELTINKSHVYKENLKWTWTLHSLEKIIMMQPTLLFSQISISHWSHDNSTLKIHNTNTLHKLTQLVDNGKLTYKDIHV